MADKYKQQTKKNLFAAMPSEDSIIGLAKQQEQLKAWLKDQRFGTITGDQGTGKSLLLYWAKNASVEQEVLVLDGHHKRDMLCREIFSSQLNLLEKGLKVLNITQQKEKELFQRLGQKRIILLIDNAGGLGRKELHFLSDLMFRTKAAVLLADTAPALKKLPLPETFVDKLKLRIPAYSKKDLQTILEKRLVSIGTTLEEPQLVAKATTPAACLTLAHEELMAKGPTTQTSFFGITIKTQSSGHVQEDLPQPMAEDQSDQTDHSEDIVALAKIVEQETIVCAPPSAVPEKPVSLHEVEQALAMVQKQSKLPSPTILAPESKKKTRRMTKYDRVVAALAKQVINRPKSSKKPKKR